MVSRASVLRGEDVGLRCDDTLFTIISVKVIKHRKKREFYTFIFLFNQEGRIEIQYLFYQGVHNLKCTSYTLHYICWNKSCFKGGINHWYILVKGPAKRHISLSVFCFVFVIQKGLAQLEMHNCVHKPFNPPPPHTHTQLFVRTKWKSCFRGRYIHYIIYESCTIRPVRCVKKTWYQFWFHVDFKTYTIV